MSADFEMEVQEDDRSVEAKVGRVAATAGSYLFALTGAFLVSIGICFAGLAVLTEGHRLPDQFVPIVLGALDGGVGFFGVLVGVLLAPKKHRPFSSWIFIVAGCVFYVWLWYQMSAFARPGEEPPPFAPSLPYLFGGGVCCDLNLRFQTFRRRRSYGS
jgi:uncharacterized membrane protein YfcA